MASPCLPRRCREADKRKKYQLKQEQVEEPQRPLPVFLALHHFLSSLPGTGWSCTRRLSPPSAVNIQGDGDYFLLPSLFSSFPLEAEYLHPAHFTGKAITAAPRWNPLFLSILRRGLAADARRGEGSRAHVSVEGLQLQESSLRIIFLICFG